MVIVGYWDYQLQVKPRDIGTVTDLGAYVINHI